MSGVQMKRYCVDYGYPRGLMAEHVNGAWCRYEDAEKLIAALTAERDRLAAVVERLPRTADGVPVTPGMLVYSEFGSVALSAGPFGPFDHLYSTRAAAEAAQKGGE